VILYIQQSVRTAVVCW